MRLCSAIALSLWATLAHAAPATWLQTLVWEMDSPLFGGISGFDYVLDGSEFVAISDRGTLLKGTLHRENGRITHVEATPPREIKNRHGAPLFPSFERDSEGLAIAPDGTIFISFEGHHRVRRYDTLAHSQILRNHKDFADLPPNGALEALAVDAAGRLYSTPERSGQINKPFPLYRFDDGAWEIFDHISRDSGFNPVGADVGPDGRFYLLERSFWGFGFGTRLRRFSILEHGLGQPETLIYAPLSLHGNLEAIAVWKAPDGLRVTLVSDDNFTNFTSTKVVEYKIPN